MNKSQNIVFSNYVHKHFGFMEKDFGFKRLEKLLGYKKNALELEFYQGKGEIEIVFFIRRDDDIFKPYISRSFDLVNILIRQEKQGGITYPDSWPGYFTSENDFDIYLKFYANLLKVSCKEQLNGDFTVFEEIHLARRKKAKIYKNT